MPRSTSIPGDPVFNVRIVEQSGRERVLAEIRKVTKREALIWLGATRTASLAISGERTWVAPAVFIRRYSSNGAWHKQHHDVWREAGRAFMAYQEFWNRTRRTTWPPTSELKKESTT